MSTTRHPNRAAVVALWAGLALTVLAAIVPYLDRAGANVLGEHIRAGYPGYSTARIDTAVTTYLISLTVLGLLGVACWSVTIWAVRAGKRWARWMAVTIFAVGTVVALTDLLIKDTSGETGLPPLLGWVGVLPCLAGMVAVGLLWRRSAGTTRPA